MGPDLERRPFLAHGKETKSKIGDSRLSRSRSRGSINRQPNSGRMMIFQTVSSLKWQLQSFDIKTAFLRGRADERELAIYPVPEFQELLNLSKEHVLLLKGNAYGRVDAPLLFYKEFRKCRGFRSTSFGQLFVSSQKQEQPSTPRPNFGNAR